MSNIDMYRTGTSSSSSPILSSSFKSSTETYDAIDSDDTVDYDLSSFAARKRKPKSFLSASQRATAKQNAQRQKHFVRPACSGCKRKCTSKFSEEMRNEINSEFWNLSWYERKLFIVSNCSSISTKRASSPNCVRKRHFHFFMRANCEKLAVCKTFFLTTLGFEKSNDIVMRHAMLNVEDSCTPPRDGRGKYPRKVIDRGNICAHIESFKPCIAHYRREHAPLRRYLPSDITINFMFSDFTQKHGNVCSYDLYRKTVNTLNISFTKLGNEQCEFCEIFDRHEHARENRCDSCETCINWGKHIARANFSRSEYRSDRSTNRGNVFSADLQKVIMLPRMDQFKTVCFTRRIVAFNESFVPVGSTKMSCPPFAVLWHEGISGRKKEDIISTFHAFFLHNRDEKKIILWVDNCMAQNKNWTFLSYLTYVINSDSISTDVIEIKFFEPGHTFMSADSFHHQVELSMKKRINVYDFNDFVDCVANATDTGATVKTMLASDFIQWKDHSSISKINRSNPRPYLSEISFIRTTRGQRTLIYRNGINTDNLQLNFLSAKAMANKISNKPLANGIERGIEKSKKDEIVHKLLPLMPTSRHDFWKSLRVADVHDLAQVE